MKDRKTELLGILEIIENDSNEIWTEGEKKEVIKNIIQRIKEI
jgi:hypothetical protein